MSSLKEKLITEIRSICGMSLRSGKKIACTNETEPGLSELDKAFEKMGLNDDNGEPEQLSEENLKILIEAIKKILVDEGVLTDDELKELLAAKKGKDVNDILQTTIFTKFQETYKRQEALNIISKLLSFQKCYEDNINNEEEIKDCINKETHGDYNPGTTRHIEGENRQKKTRIEGGKKKKRTTKRNKKRKRRTYRRK